MPQFNPRPWRELYLRAGRHDDVANALGWGQIYDVDEIEREPRLAAWIDLIGRRVDFLAHYYGLADHDPDLQFCFVKSSVVNAAAVPIGGILCIVMTDLQFFTMSCLASYLADSGPMLDVFDIEHTATTFIRPNPEEAKSGLELLTKRHESPAGTDRIAALTIAALGFVIGHEAAHLLHGHHAVETESEYITERFLTRSADAALTSRTLEFDADCTGLRNAFACLHYDGAPNSCAKFLGTIEKEMRMAVAGAAVFLTTVEIMDENEATDPSYSDYPTAYERLLFTVGSASLTLAAHSGIKGEEALSEIVLAPLIAVKVSKAILTNSAKELLEGEEARLQSNDFGQPAHRQILGRWAKIRETLSNAKIGVRGLSEAQVEPI